MRQFKSEVAKIKNDVLREIARYTYESKLEDEIDKLPRTLIESSTSYYRCCVYKERAIVAERAKFALGFSTKELNGEERLGEIVANRLEGHEINGPVLDVIETACDRCPIHKFLVTDACRGCVAHYCQNTCPKDAITIIERRAHIDQDKCIECGRCSQACHFHAIVEVKRPCERSCSAKAIISSSDRSSSIDGSLCISCGNCVVGCPFGAITDKSMMVEVIQWIKNGENVVAAVAPAVAGQFGPKVEVGQIVNGLSQLGFTHTAEVAQAADEVARLEAEEFAEMVDEKGWLASSCCPAFVEYIRTQFPEIADHIAPTPSPMVLQGRKIKKENPDYKVVFIGPCIAKKRESLQEDSCIDAVLTFEELGAMFEARDIKLEELESIDASFGKATKYGRGFSVSGGVAEALEAALNAQDLNVDLKPVKANGLEECKKMLNLAKFGKLPGNFIEGMSCEGGCIAGPATLVMPRQGENAVKKYKEEI